MIKKKLVIFMGLCCLLVFSVATGLAAEIDLSWDANPEQDVVGYKVYQSIDGGTNWTLAVDTDATTVFLPDIPDSGLVLFRVSAYDNQDESIRYNAGAWFNNDWKPLSSPRSSGIK